MSLSKTAPFAQVHHIYRSPVKLAIMSSIILGFAAITGSIAAGQYMNRAVIPLDHTFYWIAGLAAFAVVLFCIRVLPLWRQVHAPAITLSRSGITFPGKSTVAWADITENDWHTLGVGFITAGATLVVKAHGARMGGEAITLACTADEYFRLCERFQAAESRQ